MNGANAAHFHQRGAQKGKFALFSCHYTIPNGHETSERVRHVVKKLVPLRMQQFDTQKRRQAIV